jgi:hypothetical protein
MTMKLFQKHLTKGTREFELLDDAVNVRIDMPFLKKEFTVVFSILDPEPVIDGSNYAFVSVVNREPLLEFFLDKPDPGSFSDFVQKVRQGIIDEEFGKPKASSVDRKVNVEHLKTAIDMLQTYVGGDQIRPFLDTLEALRDDPHSEEKFMEMSGAFNKLGTYQGAVLSYAPYISTLLSDNDW